MTPPSLLLLVLCVVVAVAVAPCSGVDPVTTYCAKNYTNARTKASIGQVLAELVPRASASYNATATAGGIWGLAQCRGDIPQPDCALCLAAAARELARACHGSTDGRVWYDYCFLRYDDADFLGLPDTGYTLILLNTMNATGVDLAAFDRAERMLMSRVAGDVASTGLARETARLGGSGGATGTTIYGLGWCTTDITAADCGLCVAQAVAELPTYCRYRRGCRVLYSSCMARYETYPFFFPVDNGGGSSSQDLLAAAAAAAAAGEYETVVLNP